MYIFKFPYKKRSCSQRKSYWVSHWHMQIACVINFFGSFYWQTLLSAMHLGFRRNSVKIW